MRMYALDHVDMAALRAQLEGRLTIHRDRLRRFETILARHYAGDRLSLNRATFLAGEAPSVPLVEIRE